MRSRYFWPVALILAGVLFLLDNLGWLPGSAWGWIWPLVLIWLGVGFLMRGRGGRRLETAQESLALDGAASASITFRHGAGRLSLSAGADSSQLFSGSFGGGVEKRVNRTGDRLDLTLEANPRDWADWTWPGNWAGERDGLREVTLPAQAGRTRVRIESGAASVNVRIPPGVAARIEGTVGVGALNVDASRFPKRDGGYESADFEMAANRVEIEGKSGVGSVEVR